MISSRTNRSPSWAQDRGRGGRRAPNPRGRTSVHLLWFVFLVLAAGCKAEAPTGVTSSQLQGVWSGALENVTLLGRSVSGDVDWQFGAKDFEVRFLDPPVGQTERIGGNWKFSGGKLVLTLRTSFPIGDDAGVTDTLFVSIFSSEISMRTSAGSDILLYKTQAVLGPEDRPGVNGLVCRWGDAPLSRRRVTTTRDTSPPYAG